MNPINIERRFSVQLWEKTKNRWHSLDFAVIFHFLLSTSNINGICVIHDGTMLENMNCNFHRISSFWALFIYLLRHFHCYWQSIHSSFPLPWNRWKYNEWLVFIVNSVFSCRFEWDFVDSIFCTFSTNQSSVTLDIGSFNVVTCVCATSKFYHRLILLFSFWLAAICIITAENAI